MNGKRLIWIFLTLSITSISFVISQNKPGRCPENLSFPICISSCSNDMSCFGNNKCCRTNCNGQVCMKPLPQQASPVVSHRKPGNCPNRLNVPICAMTCPNDLRCGGNNKCCRTECGGSVCIEPMIQQQAPTPPAQTAVCPAKPGGPWVCTSTCASDNDCRKPQKCCKNRCGALTCMKT